MRTDVRVRAWRMAMWLAFALLARPTQAVDFHVDPAGSDSNAGSRSRPFATLERARDAVRALATSAEKRGGVTVWIHPGDYALDRTLRFGAEDSGTASAPTVWRAARGGVARVHGGLVLGAGMPVTDPSVLERFDPAARTQVREVRIGVEAGRALGELRSRGFGRSTVPSHAELFHGHRPMTLARWPNEGEFAKIAGIPQGSAQGDDHGGRVGKLPDGFHYEGDRPNRWRDLGNVWVHGYWAWDWANSYERIERLDREQRRIVTAAPHGLYGFRVGQRYYFLNVLEELDRPGEYYVDRDGGRIYFWPPEQPASGPGAGGGGGAEPELMLSRLEGPLLSFSNATHIRFEGALLEATRGSAVEIRGGRNVQVAGCLIRNVGNHGVQVDGGQDHSVASCDIIDTGDGGVGLTGGDRRTLSPGGHSVDNCYFARQGRWSKCYVPAVHLHGVGLRVTGNLIEEHPHCAILYWGNDHRIEFNEIRRIALETGDVGAIYTGRDYTFRGNKVLHNFIHHTGGVGMGSMGVYMDDCVSGTEIRGNIFYKVQRAVFLGGGRDHDVANNIFVDCNHAVELDGRGLDPSPVWRSMVDETMRQRMSDVPAALYRERYPALLALDGYYGGPGGPALSGQSFKGVPPGGNRVTGNLCVGKWTRIGWHASTNHWVLANNWVDPIGSFAAELGDRSRPADFAPKRSSVAVHQGFEPLPVDRMGLQMDGLRRAGARSGLLRRP